MTKRKCCCYTMLQEQIYRSHFSTFCAKLALKSTNWQPLVLEQRSHLTFILFRAFKQDVNEDLYKIINARMTLIQIHGQALRKVKFFIFVKYFVVRTIVRSRCTVGGHKSVNPVIQDETVMRKSIETLVFLGFSHQGAHILEIKKRGLSDRRSLFLHSIAVGCYRSAFEALWY